MDKVVVFQIEKKNYMIQIQLVPINIFSQVFFFKFIYGVLQGDNFLAGYFKIIYFNFFLSIRDSLRVLCLFLQIKKTARNLLVMYMNNSQKSREFPHCECTIY